MAEGDEEIAKRTEKYLKLQETAQVEEVEIDSRFISDELLVFTADWYRSKYPGFPDSYYEIFEKFRTSQEGVLRRVQSLPLLPPVGIQLKCDDKSDVTTEL